MKITIACAWSCGKPGCLVTPDPQYERLLPDTQWCTHCGPLQVERQAQVKGLLDAGFGVRLGKALEIVSAQIHGTSS